MLKASKLDSTIRELSINLAKVCRESLYADARIGHPRFKTLNNSESKHKIKQVGI
jgi:hypothetical protein